MGLLPGGHRMSARANPFDGRGLVACRAGRLVPCGQAWGETMFWIIGGAILAVVLVGAWLYDRRWGFNETHMPNDAAKAQAQVDAWRSPRQERTRRLLAPGAF